MANTKIERNGKTYVHHVSSGYYGLVVPPGSPDDNTMGKVGIHWEYMQYASDTDLVRELRAILPEFRRIEDAEEKAAEEKRLAQIVGEDARYERLKKTGLCPKCGTWCYGDCDC